MKKIILSLAALLSVGIAAAQSYPKQPDRSVVTYIEYKRAAPVQNDSIAKQEIAVPTQNDDSKNQQVSMQPATSVNANNSVTENSRNNKARKE